MTSRCVLSASSQPSLAVIIGANGAASIGQRIGNIYGSTSENTGPDVQLDEPRNAEQNKKLWAALSDISRQVEWPVNGKLGKLSTDDWKDIFSADLTREQRIAQGLNGGFVLLGLRTSRLKKREMSDLLEIIMAFGSEHGVIWTERKDAQ